VLEPSLATIIAAALGLAGTLIGLGVGYRRWSRERAAQRYGRFENERQDVYRSMWDRVEQINASLRRQRVDAAGFAQAVADLNEFIIRNGVHVDEADHDLVNEYLAAVQRFHAVVTKLEPEDQVSYGLTQRIPAELLGRVKALADAQRQVNDLRTSLRGKVRAVIGGPE
jgi:hypothetical protein